MSKNFQEIQEFIREKVIMASHPECKTYEEALEKELGFGCVVELEGFFGKNPLTITHYWDEDKELPWDKVSFELLEEYEECLKRGFITKIIGKPITLSRILNTLESHPNNWGIVAGHLSKINRKECSYDYKCKWDLTKEEFEDQPEETQVAIAKLLGWEVYVR